MKQSRSQGVSWGDLNGGEKKFITRLVRLSDFEVVDWNLTFTTTRASLTRRLLGPAGPLTFPDPPPNEAFYCELERKGFLGMRENAAPRQGLIDVSSEWIIWPTTKAVAFGRLGGAWE